MLFIASKCAKLYNVKTGCTLDARFKEHLADLKHHMDKPVANRFNQAGHSIHNTHERTVVSVHGQCRKDRKDMNSHLINTLGSR